jgi:hypothetical protein
MGQSETPVTDTLHFARPTLASVLILFLLVTLAGCAEERNQQIDNSRIIKAKIYSHEGNFRQLFSEWKEVGINTAFVSEALDSKREFQALTKEFQIRRFVILPIFFNPDFLKENPEYYSITDQGEKAIDDWVEFVCPSRDEYREMRIDWVRRIVAKHQPDGISLDFIRHFVFWSWETLAEDNQKIMIAKDLCRSEGE